MTAPGKLAFFDLDHTILPQDTQALFAQFVMTREPWRRSYLFWYLPALLPAAIGLIGLRTMKRLFSSYLRGMPAKTLRTYAAEFARDVVPAVAYPEIIAEIERLRAEGYTLILNSASPEFYLTEIGMRLGFDHVIGTRLIVEDPMPFLPEITGPNNKHGEKITAMIDRNLIPEKDGPFPESWAFSDSPADLPLLSIAEHAVTIHPGERLEGIARERGWKILTPKRPYRGKWGGRFATLRLALGLGKKFLRAR